MTFEDLAATLEDLLAAVQRLEAKVDELARARPAKRLLSRRAAAKLLGVDRGTTLEQLIRDEHLHLVMGRIPDTEIERLLASGIPEPKVRGRRRPTDERSPKDEAAALRAMKI